jgi:hypothetical protein
MFTYAAKKFGNGDVNCIQETMQKLEYCCVHLLLTLFTVVA